MLFLTDIEHALYGACVNNILYNRTGKANVIFLEA